MIVGQKRTTRSEPIVSCSKRALAGRNAGSDAFDCIRRHSSAVGAASTRREGRVKQLLRIVLAGVAALAGAALALDQARVIALTKGETVGVIVVIAIVGISSRSRGGIRRRNDGAVFWMCELLELFGRPLVDG